jgi:hypothetical protein
MEDSEDNDRLSPGAADYTASALRAALAIVPVIGAGLGELATQVIPHQRLDRLVRFARVLQERLAAVEGFQRRWEEVLNRCRMGDQDLADLMEEVIRQAARATTDARRECIASLIANGLTSDQISHIESKHLLRMLGDLNDIEVIWLRFYLHPTIRGDEEFRSKHAAVLKSVPAHLESPQPEVDKAALQKSYSEHLVRLGLLEERFKVDPKTKMLEVNPATGIPKHSSYEVTSLGRLLLREIGLGDSTFKK